MLAVPAYFMPQGISADLIATKYGFSRDDVDAYAVQSQKRAAEAWRRDASRIPITPVRDINGLTLLDHDEHMRPTTDMQSLASLKPSFVDDGRTGRLRRGRDAGPSRSREGSSMSITPAIPRASSTAPRRCCSARGRPAQARA